MGRTAASVRDVRSARAIDVRPKTPPIPAQRRRGHRVSPPTTVVAPGDRVKLRKDGPGTVVAVINEGPVAHSAAPRAWRGMGRGIVVKLDSGGLVHISEPLFELITSDGSH